MISSDSDILALFYDSPLVHVAQLLIGSGDVRMPGECMGALYDT
jgi:histidine ammonia-lyase